jgi:hypothetical protein
VLQELKLFDSIDFYLEFVNKFEGQKKKKKKVATNQSIRLFPALFYFSEKGIKQQHL